MTKQEIAYICRWLLMLVAIVMAGIVVSCSGNSEVDKQLTAADNLMEQHPDSALALLELIEHKQIESKHDKASYGLLINRARLLCGKTILQDYFIDNSISYYKEQNDSTNLCEAYQLASFRSQHRLNQDSAIYYLQRAIEVVPSNQDELKARLYTEIAYQLSRPSARKNYAAAIDNSKQALEYASSAMEKARALHDIGILYSYLGQNDSCLLYIEQALELIDTDNPNYIGFALNYSSIPGADFHKSKSILSAIKTQSLGKHITLGFLYLNNGMLDSASMELDKANVIYNATPEKYTINTFNNLRQLSSCVNYGYRRPIRPSEGVTTNDSISEKINLDHRLSDENIEANAKLQTELLEHKIERQQVWMVFLVIVVFLVLGLFITYYRWHKKYKDLQQKIDRERVSQIVLEASDDSTDEDTMRTIISNRIQLCTERFRNTGYYNRLQKLSIDRTDEAFLPLKQRVDIQEKVLECFSDFVIDLKNNGAKLNLEDITFCIFSLLAIDNRTISKCMGVSEGALRTRKTRLKGKLSAVMFQIVFHESTD